MFDYGNFFDAHPNGVLATVDKGKVKTRIFQYLFTNENRVYFFTNENKPVYNQLVKNQEVSFCFHSEGYSPVTSVSGKAIFVDDLNLKREYLDKNPNIKSIYKSAENPELKLFYIDVEEVETFNYQEGAKKYQL